MKTSYQRLGLLVAGFCLVFFAVNAAGQEPASGQAAPAKKSASSGAAHKSGYDQALLHPAALKATAPDTFQVKFETTAGDFIVTVTRAWAPLGADRFYNLCKHHFYDGASFFRVVPGFVVQFGLTGNPAVNAVWEKARFQDDPVKETNRPGTLVFATAGPNTRTSQLFINLGNNGALDRQGFSAFGEVTDGFDVVKKINSQYGEQPDQGKITSEGDAYIDKNFPKIDKIKATTIIGEPAAPAKKPAAKPAAKPQS